MDVSIVLPAFNCKEMMRLNVERLHDYMAGWSSSFEIIVVDDGSKVSERVVPEGLPSSVRVIQLRENCGKGAAVSQGMLAASGDVRIFTDIDLPYDLAAIRYTAGLISKKGFHFVAGDRSLPNSQYVHVMPLHRKIASKIFSKLVTLLVIGGIYDSQCGFKGFSAPLAKALFPLLTIKRFSFDVEIFYLILKYNIVIYRIPVRLKDPERSTINLFKHALPMACRIMSIPLKWYGGRYHSEDMRRLWDKPYWEE